MEDQQRNNKIKKNSIRSELIKEFQYIPTFLLKKCQNSATPQGRTVWTSHIASRR